LSSKKYRLFFNLGIFMISKCYPENLEQIQLSCGEDNSSETGSLCRLWKIFRHATRTDDSIGPTTIPRNPNTCRPPRIEKHRTSE